MVTTDTTRNETRSPEPARQATGTRESSQNQYQDLKFAIHRKLLDRINLEAIYAMPGERVRQEIRPSVAKLVNEERTPLSLAEKDRLIEEVLDEVFGLGPLEPLLRDRTVSDILVTTPHLIYIERNGNSKERYRIRRRCTSDAHHRACRFPCRPPDR